MLTQICAKCVPQISTISMTPAGCDSSASDWIQQKNLGSVCLRNFSALCLCASICALHGDLKSRGLVGLAHPATQASKNPRRLLSATFHFCKFLCAHGSADRKGGRVAHWCAPQSNTQPSTHRPAGRCHNRRTPRKWLTQARALRSRSAAQLSKRLPSPYN